MSETDQPAAAHVETLVSADGTTIAYERAGTGVPLILVGGAFSTRQGGYELRDALAQNFTVYVIDRRGRGDSTDTQPYAVEREVEDLATLVAVAGSGANGGADSGTTGDASGSVNVYGHSSGAVLALEAASRGLTIAKLAVYEPPYTFDPNNPAPAVDNGVQAALDAGDKEGATEAFMRFTGMDDQALTWAKQAPFWAGMVAIAHTAAYDLALTADGKVPAERLAAITVPTLVMDGGASPAWAARAAESVAVAIPDARRLTVEGQAHGADVAVLAPLLIEFFG